MPRHPLYVAYLPKEAQEVIGRVHQATEPARHLLEQEGLYYEGFVDIFDAGPVLQARVNELRAVRTSKLVQAATDGAAAGQAAPMLVSNTTIEDFRIIVSDHAPQAGQLQLDAAQLAVLHCSVHSPLRVMPLNIER